MKGKEKPGAERQGKQRQVWPREGTKGTGSLECKHLLRIPESHQAFFSISPPFWRTLPSLLGSPAAVSA